MPVRRAPLVGDKTPANRFSPWAGQPRCQRGTGRRRSSGGGGTHPRPLGFRMFGRRERAGRGPGPNLVGKVEPMDGSFGHDLRVANRDVPRTRCSTVVRHRRVLYIQVMRHLPRAQVGEGLIGWWLSGFLCFVPVLREPRRLIGSTGRGSGRCGRRRRTACGRRGRSRRSWRRNPPSPGRTLLHCR
jgi:hypothetical protein